jgi:hypothetical protein
MFDGFIETLFRVKVKNILGFIVEKTIVDCIVQWLSSVASSVTMIDEHEQRLKIIIAVSVDYYDARSATDRTGAEMVRHPSQSQS